MLVAGWVDGFRMVGGWVDGFRVVLASTIGTSLLVVLFVLLVLLAVGLVVRSRRKDTVVGHRVQWK
jgi:putative copper export protein